MAYRRTPAVQARLEAQRAALLQAASALLAEGGYAACTIVAVAGRAGVATGTVYRHFADKRALGAEVFRVVVDRELLAVRTVAEAAADEHPAQAVRAVIETFAGRALKAPRLAYALLAEPVDPEVEALRLHYRREFRDIIAAAVAGGRRRGVLPEQDAVVVGAALVGAIGEALVGPLAPSGGRPRDRGGPDTVATLVQLAIRAIGADRAAYA